MIDHISKKIKVDIIVFKKKHEYYEIIYQTDKHEKKIPIKILFHNGHCTFIYDNNNLEIKGFTFCPFCRKSFKYLLSHKCKKGKCPLCFLYYESW